MKKIFFIFVLFFFFFLTLGIKSEAQAQSCSADAPNQVDYNQSFSVSWEIPPFLRPTGVTPTTCRTNSSPNQSRPCFKVVYCIIAPGGGCSVLDNNLLPQSETISGNRITAEIQGYRGPTRIKAWLRYNTGSGEQSICSDQFISIMGTSASCQAGTITIYNEGEGPNDDFIEPNKNVILHYNGNYTSGFSARLGEQYLIAITHSDGSWSAENFLTTDGTGKLALAEAGRINPPLEGDINLGTITSGQFELGVNRIGIQDFTGTHIYCPFTLAVDDGSQTTPNEPQTGSANASPNLLTSTNLCDFAGAAESESRTKCDQCAQGIAPGGIPGEPGISTPFGCIPANPQGLVERVLRIAIGIAGGIAFLMIAYGSISIALSAGNPEKLNQNKEVIMSAIAGLLLIVFSAVILRIIGVDILQIPGF